jgi:hypothetical protein
MLHYVTVQSRRFLPQLLTLLFVDYPADLKFFNTIEKMPLNLHLRSERKYQGSNFGPNRITLLSKAPELTTGF